jgi:hypothetical protein
VRSQSYGRPAMAADFNLGNRTEQSPRLGQTAAGIVAGYIGQLQYCLTRHGQRHMRLPARGPSGWQCPG